MVVAQWPWQTQGKRKSSWENYPPYMPPHEYVVFGKCNYAAWDGAVLCVHEHPTSYLAYFRSRGSRVAQ